DIVAIKFPSAAAGETFFESLTAIAVQAEGAQRVDHREATLGVLPGLVLRTPPSGRTSTSETVSSASLYNDGIGYLVRFMAGPGSVCDDDVLACLLGEARQ